MRKVIFSLFLLGFFACGSYSYDFNTYKSVGVRYMETFGCAINNPGYSIYSLDQEADYFFNRMMSVGIGFGLWMYDYPGWTEDFSAAFKFPIYVSVSFYLLPRTFSPFASIEAGRIFNFAFSGGSHLIFVPCAGAKLSIQSHFDVFIEIKTPMIEGRPMLIMPSIGVLI